MAAYLILLDSVTAGSYSVDYWVPGCDRDRGDCHECEHPFAEVQIEKTKENFRLLYNTKGLPTTGCRG